ncbi:hypothetical protein BDQ94DRAFT_153742 [Aspergillus welwitschiae]|uniref:Uncharacterized protein n=1 Tax=Aspergillus welwitschiae TaxID=1341132 RepID=A0A3F3PKU0_9EURO|nr:hypothetical protein BDQ94DRAFT_153742 [Aspergillus welwitschiae]RDH27551.1 hypothetical protein BDQ94DRAFT_153742 [Aspergillus welwitschiae]
MPRLTVNVSLLHVTGRDLSRLADRVLSANDMYEKSETVRQADTARRITNCGVQWQSPIFRFNQHRESIFTPISS